MSKMLLIGAAGVGAYLLFREQIDAMLSGGSPPPTSPSGAPSGVPVILPNGTIQYPTISNSPTAPKLPTITPTAPVNVLPPAWVVGQWYWVQGSGRQFAIDASGGVTLLNNGQTSHGTYNNNVIFIDGNSSPVTQNGSYMRTLNQTTGEVSDYSRTPSPVTTQPPPTINIPTPTIPSPYPTIPNPNHYPSGPVGGCVVAPCAPEFP